MSDETARLDQILLDDLKEQWPKTDDGRLCSRLLQRYCYTLILKTAGEARCDPMSAQAEAGALKAVSRMTKDFAEIVLPAPKREPKKPMQALHRFQEKDESQ